MTRPSARAPRRVRIWPIPIALALATGVGLVAALVGDGVWDLTSWIGLAAPIATMTWCVSRRPR